MSDSKPRRKLAAILAADVVGFSKMMGENEDRTLKNLKACRSLTDESIISNHGRIFGSAGDSIIAEFASPVDAVIAATEFQRNLSLRNEGVTEENKMMFRVGLNLGDVIVEGDNLYGDGVNVASRLEALAEPGGISLSGKFHDEVSRKLDMSFVSTGDQEMKNIQNPIPTFKIELTELEKTESGGGPEIIDPVSKSVFEDNLPIVTSTKSLTGHTLGATGVQECIYSILMMNGNFIAGNKNLTNPIPEANGIHIPEKSLEKEFNNFMSNSFGFGGTNVSLVLSKYKD